MKTQLRMDFEDLRKGLAIANVEIEKLKLAIWKLENPPKFKFNDKVLYAPYGVIQSIVIEKNPLIIKGEESIKTYYNYPITQCEFERVYYVEKGSKIITISETSLVNFDDIE